MKTTVPKITISESLRAEIVAFKADLCRRVKDHKDRLQAAEADLARLEPIRSAIAADVNKLESTARHDDEAGIEKLAALRGRLTVCERELERAKTSLQNIQGDAPNTERKKIFHRLRRDYQQHLVDAFLPYFLPLFLNEVSSVRAIQQSPAYTNIDNDIPNHQLESLHSGYSDLASERRVSQTLAILDRALTGEISLRC